MPPPSLLPHLLFIYLSLASPVAHPRDDRTCSGVSLSVFNWTAKAFHYHSLISLSGASTSNIQSAGDGYLSFNLSNPALGPSFDQLCTATSTQLDQFFYLDKWFTCLYTPTSSSSSHLNPILARTSAASFRFDKVSGRFEVKQDWECDDGPDPNYPTTSFSGAGGVNIALDCKVDVWQNQNWGSEMLYLNQTVECGVLDVAVGLDSLEAMA
ncbi:hypothetical protein QBC36DRAFT_357133 [Triangularia setosa]|uniref:AA1-like domain-containing protein n=1 Tax=Triangularia setosa TaxID=2587417 RepID=A0AAN7A5X8_9PEZI|nr:hypothetical protein QBC36DRAFT_357133 [Podospora setosa]